MTTVRGRPPGLAGGINGSKMAHWASLRSEGYDLRAVVGGMSASQQGCEPETLIPHDLNDWVALWIDSQLDFCPADPSMRSVPEPKVRHAGTDERVLKRPQRTHGLQKPNPPTANALLP